MGTEARASPRLRTLELGIVLGREYAENLERIELIPDQEMLRALTKYELDWDYMRGIVTSAGCKFDVQSYDEGVSEEETEDDLRYELYFTPQPQPDRELKDLMVQIIAQRYLINVIFSDKFGFELFKEAEPDSRIICTPWEGFNDWNVPLCVAAIANYIIKTMDGARITVELNRTLQTIPPTLATRIDLINRYKSIALLKAFFESHNCPGDKYGGAIKKLKDIQSLRSQIKPIHYTDKGFNKFVKRYGLEGMLDPETKQGDFYPLICKVLVVTHEALIELRKTLEVS